MDHNITHLALEEVEWIREEEEEDGHGRGGEGVEQTRTSACIQGFF
jgi:hypothetical protein